MAHIPAPTVAPNATAGHRKTAPPPYKVAYQSPAIAPAAGQAAVFHTAVTAPMNLPHFDSLA